MSKIVANVLYWFFRILTGIIIFLGGPLVLTMSWVEDTRSGQKAEDTPLKLSSWKEYAVFAFTEPLD